MNARGSSVPAVLLLLLTLSLGMVLPVRAYPSFGLTASPVALRLYQGSSDTSIITVSSVDGFGPADVTLSTYVQPDIPTGPSVSISPVNVTVKAGGLVSSTLSISTTPTTHPGTYVVTVAGVWNPPCLFLTPACMIPSLYYSVDVTVTVVLRGDVNGDCSVSILDLAMITAAYGSTPVSSRWNPSAELDGNSAVNIMDASIVAINLGSTCI